MKPTQFALLGLGEAGAAIATDLARAGAEVHGYDPGSIPSPAGVTRHAAPEDAVSDADVVLAVTPAAGAKAALSQVLGAVPTSAMYADLSTSAPGLKRELSALADERGVGFVDVALMAPVAGRGLGTPALASGPAAQPFAAAMSQWGMPVEAVGDQPGLAATRKLLRSVVMKGLAQLLLEALEAAEAAGLTDETWDNLVAQLSSVDEVLVKRLVSGTERHAARRLHEMEATIELLSELGVDPVMSRATADRLHQQTGH